MITGIGGAGFTATFTGPVEPVQPLLSVTVRLKEPDDVTDIICSVDILLHKLPDTKFDERLTVPPSQNDNGPLGVIIGAGKGFTTTLTGVAAFEQPEIETVSP